MIRAMREVSILIVILASVFSSRPAAASETSSGFPFWVANIKASYPQIMSAELGATYQLKIPDSNVSHGPFISYEPGLTGQKVHAGYSVAIVHGGIEWIAVGRLSASYFQPWSSEFGLQSGANYYGIELVGSYNMFLLSAGQYFNSENDKSITAVGVGFGF